MKIVVLDKMNGYNSLDDILKSHDTREIAEFKCITISKLNDIAIIVLSSDATSMKAIEMSHSSFYNCLALEKIAEIEGHIYIWASILR